MAARGAPQMVALGYGKFVRSDRIVMLEPLSGDEGRGGGARTRVWVEGVPDPVIASRTERSILDDMEGRSEGSRRRRRRAPDGQFELF
jgi:hypothetical protein